MPILRPLALTALLLLTPAAAQVGGLKTELLRASVLAGLSTTGTVLSGPLGGGQVKITLKPRGAYVEAASAILTGTDAASAGRLYAALTGNDPQPLTDYLADAGVQAGLIRGLSVAAGEYQLGLKRLGSVLTLDVTLRQQSGFAAVPASRVLGHPQAATVIRIYSDFQCPYCQQAELEALPAVQALVRQDPGLRLEFHHLPLERIHPNARSAAEAAECAANQAQFWAYKDELFARSDWQRQPDPSAVYARVAASVPGLNQAAWTACVATHAGKAAVDAGLAEAERLRVAGTPTVYINGYQVSDPYDAASYRALLDFVRAK